MFKNFAYAMIPNKKKDKLKEKRIKYVFLGYCEGMKTYRLICLDIKKIIKNKVVMFMEDSGSIRNDLEIRPSGRIEGPTMVVMDGSFKLPLFYGGGQFVDGNE